jgi:sugar phosphate isomerase/epimerase
MPRDLRAVTEATMAKVRAYGFTGVACRFFEPLEAKEADVKRLRRVMEAGGVDPCQAVAQHPDLVHPDEATRAEGIQAMQHMCRVTRWLGAGNLYVRPGSINPRGSWYPHPDNFKKETFHTLVSSLRQVCAAAEAEGVMLAVEGHVLSMLDTPERIKELIEAVGSDTLRFNADPVNFVGSLRDAYDTTPLVNHLFDVLGPYTICGHAKDFYVQDRLVLHLEETVIGEGLLDQATYLRRFEQYCPDGYVQIEHLPEDKIPQAREAFYRIGLEAGITWKGL